ncbi:MAG TPA: hypothetical protein VMN60_02890 [Longimicrobiales bacterium]|nr:hypothetical protein [Longimicrobiales bacterium]
MQPSEDRPVKDPEAVGPARIRRAVSSQTDRFPGTARTAPRGADSRIGDDETHRRLQEARNRARHSTEDMVRRELGPEWVLE